jgi:hypothetical protein
MSARIQQYQVIGIGLPQTSRRLQVVGSINFYAVTPQDCSTHVARGLVRIDEENFLVIETEQPRSGGG